MSRHLGYLRLYVVVTLLWLVATGAVAYFSNATARTCQETTTIFAQLSRTEMSYAKEVSKDTEQNLAAASTCWQENRDRASQALLAVPVVPLSLPIIYFAWLWVAAGFRRAKTTTPLR
jgi:hypothetical protein